MNTFPWILQVLLAMAFLAAGSNHAFRAEQMKAQRGGQWVMAVPRPGLATIGGLEILAAMAVVVPGLTGIRPGLTPPAAACLALLMFCAAVFHLVRGEYLNPALNSVLFVLALAVAWGRVVYPR